MRLRQAVAALILLAASAAVSLSSAATLVARQNNVMRLDPTYGFFKPANAYTVVVYRMGAVCSGAPSGVNIPVRAGHAVKVGDKIGVFQVATGSFVYSGTSTVQTVAATQLTMTGGTYTCSDGDYVVSLGPDAATGSTPNFTASDLQVFKGNTTYTNSRISTRSDGEYAFWMLARAWWEVILQGSTGTVLNVVPVRVSPEVTPFEWGARGDGATNDSAAFQAAADSGIVPIRIPAASYKITTPVSLSDDAQFIGDGWGTVLTLTAGSTSDIELFLLPNGTDRVRIANMKLDANGSNQSGSNVVCIRTNNSNDVTIEGMYLTGSKDRAALWILSGVSTNYTINRNTITGCGAECIETRSLQGAVVSNNTISAWGTVTAASPAWGLQESCKRLTVVGNTFTNTVANQFAVESASTGFNVVCDESTFSNNVLDGNGISPGANGFSGYFFHSTFSGNTHINGGNTHRSGYEIVGTDDVIIGNTIENGSLVVSSVIGGATERITVIGNTITNSLNLGSGILVGSGSAALNDIHIVGNSVYLSHATPQTGISLGLYGTTAQINRVSALSNKVRCGGTADGIRLLTLAGSTDITIRGNEVHGCGTGVLVESAGNVDEVTISENDFRGNTTAISGAPTSGTFRISGNITANDQLDTTLKRVSGNQGTAQVFGDFALGAGWGTTASLAVTSGSRDPRFEVTVTSSGSGQSAATATIALTFKDGAWSAAPFATCQFNGGTGTITTATPVTWTSSTTVLTIKYPDLPVAASTYKIACQVQG